MKSRFFAGLVFFLIVGVVAFMFLTIPGGLPQGTAMSFIFGG